MNHEGTVTSASPCAGSHGLEVVAPCGGVVDDGPRGHRRAPALATLSANSHAPRTMSRDGPVEPRPGGKGVGKPLGQRAAVWRYAFVATFFGRDVQGWADAGGPPVQAGRNLGRTDVPGPSV